MNYCYRKAVYKYILYWEVVPFLEGPLSEVPLYLQTSSTLIITTHAVGAVSNLDVSSIDQQTLSLSWTGVENADSYFVTVRNYSGDVASSRSVDRQQIGNQYSLQIGGLSKFEEPLVWGKWLKGSMTH